MLGARVHLERSPERPEEVDQVAQAQVGEPVGPAADHAEMDGDDPGDRVGGVDRERPAQDHPAVIAGPDVHELSGARAGRDIGGVIRLEPLARQDLPALHELRRGEAHRHAVGRSSASPDCRHRHRPRPRRLRHQRSPRRLQRRPFPCRRPGWRHPSRRRRIPGRPPGRPPPRHPQDPRTRRSGRRTRRAHRHRSRSATARRLPPGRPRRGTHRSGPA